MKKISYSFVFIGCLALSSCGSGTTDISRSKQNEASQAQIATVSLSPLMRGKATYSRCKACHTLDEGGKNLIGPNLYNVMGRMAGTRDDFIYSKAMMGSGIVWTDEELMAYLENPLKYIPGNRMAFAGLREPSTRENLIIYLRSETDPNFVMKPEYNAPYVPRPAANTETETP